MAVPELCLIKLIFRYTNWEQIDGKKPFLFDYINNPKLSYYSVVAYQTVDDIFSRNVVRYPEAGSRPRRAFVMVRCRVAASTLWRFLSLLLVGVTLLLPSCRKCHALTLCPPDLRAG